MREKNTAEESVGPDNSKSIQFDLSSSADSKNFVRLIDEIQSQGTTFRLHQDGNLVWVDFEV